MERPAEWDPAWVEILDAVDDWERYRVLRNGTPLQVMLRALPGGRRPALVADWPRSNPGRYSVQLHSGGTSHATLDVLVTPSKLSEDSYIRMLEDLQGRLLASVTLGLQRMGALAGIALSPPGRTTRVQELTRLRLAVEGTGNRIGLVSVLTELARDPHRVLRGVEQWTPRHAARRPSPARLAQAVSRAGNVDKNHGLLNVVDLRVEHTCDVYENRIVEAYTREVEYRLRRLSRPVGFQKDDAVSTQARELLATLTGARRLARFLDEVSLPRSLPTHLTMVLLRRPPYRAALQGYLEFHRDPVVELRDPALAAPLDNVPRLYQLWGTLEIVDAVLYVAAELGYWVDHQELVKRDSGHPYLEILPNGKPAVSLTHPERRTRVEVIPERTYGRSARLHSLTRDQRPDVSIEVRSTGQPPRVYLFDPKYKLDGENSDSAESSPAKIDGAESSRPKKEDLDKMHAYRDAIRDAQGHPVVRYAAILFPGDPERYPPDAALPDVEALRGYPGHEEPLRDRLREVLRTALAV